jgi:hypothetical protein
MRVAIVAIMVSGLACAGSARFVAPRSHNGEVVSILAEMLLRPEVAPSGGYVVADREWIMNVGGLDSVGAHQLSERLGARGVVGAATLDGGCRQSDSQCVGVRLVSLSRSWNRVEASFRIFEVYKQLPCAGTSMTIVEFTRRPDGLVVSGAGSAGGDFGSDCRP